MIRLVAIGFLAVFAWTVSLFVIGLFTTSGKNDWLLIPISIIVIILGTWLGFRIFMPNRPAPQMRPLVELETEGIAERQEFRALRAFEVEEFEDEGRHLFIELDDRSVLFLCGQYLYDFDNNFPSSHFSVIRNKSERWVYEVEPLGPPLKIDCLLPHYSKEYMKKHGLPEDGTIYQAPYDVLKDEIKAA